jgi:hypothetical protein
MNETNNQPLCYGNRLLRPAIQFQRMELCLLTTISCPSGLTLFCSLFYFIHPSFFSWCPSSHKTKLGCRLYHHQGTICTIRRFHSRPQARTSPKVRGRAKTVFCVSKRHLLLRIWVQHRILPLFCKKKGVSLILGKCWNIRIGHSAIFVCFSPWMSTCQDIVLLAIITSSRAWCDRGIRSVRPEWIDFITRCNTCHDRHGDCVERLRASAGDIYIAYCQFPLLNPCLLFMDSQLLFSDPPS